MDKPPVCVWFKKDLRIIDHEPLYRASEIGAIIPIYIIEPEIIMAPDFDGLHWNFIRECLLELDNQLSRMGQSLIIQKGEAVSVLEKIRKVYRFRKILSHQETGNSITYHRDKQVLEWTKHHSSNRSNKRLKKSRWLVVALGRADEKNSYQRTF